MADPKQRVDPPHPANASEASDGEGTVTESPEGETLDRPVLDGATQSDEAEREVKNPRRGMEDPGLVRDTETGEKTVNPYG